VGVAGKPSKAIRCWKPVLCSLSEKTKKGKVFGIRSQLKELSKSNDVHAQNKTF
jgi:hypothetical protein